jgi:hypothetical protein
VKGGDAAQLGHKQHLSHHVLHASCRESFWISHRTVLSACCFLLRVRGLLLCAGDWQQQKSIADRHLRVYVRNVDYDTMQLRDGVRIFVAEAYDPSCAPPAEADPVLQGAALNAKPPKPPR